MAPEGWSWWWWREGENCGSLWGEQFGGWWAGQSDLSPQENYSVNPHKSCVWLYIQAHEWWEHNWEQSHRFIKGLLHVTNLTGITSWWDERQRMRGEEWRCPHQGKGKPCWAARAGAAQTPLCQRSRAATAAHEALETLQCRATREQEAWQLPGHTWGTSVLFRVYQKHKDFTIFWGLQGCVLRCGAIGYT